MTVVVRNHEAECDTIFRNVDKIEVKQDEFKLFMGGYSRSFDKDIYSYRKETRGGR